MSENRSFVPAYFLTHDAGGHFVFTHKIYEIEVKASVCNPSLSHRQISESLRFQKSFPEWLLRDCMQHAKFIDF